MYDLLIIGGGINGVGIARDAAGRGLDVALCEKDDLAAHTSSSSTKLIHGGLRYLEHFEFRLVREALIEREVLLESAPHIIWPLRLTLPYDTGLRPAWLLRLGLFIYDHLGGRKRLPATKRVDLRAMPHKEFLDERLSFGFEFSDCWVDDARLVVLNATDAYERGAKILTRTACIALNRQDDHWIATLKKDGDKPYEIRARAIINAAGPWVDDVVSLSKPGRNVANVKLVKGSHIIVNKLYDGDHCYFFQNADDRVIFTIPYENKYTLIGTTDTDFTGDRNQIEISEEETTYLCKAINDYLKIPISTEDIVWRYAGVRPLYNDNSANNSTMTRDYTFAIDADNKSVPILSIFGGKITTYRKLAEHALERMSEYISIDHKKWTADTKLPGGDIGHVDFEDFAASLGARYPFLPDKTSFRFARCYGTRADKIIGTAKTLDELGVHFGYGLYQAEVTYLVEHEFATTPEDILWRRTKLGLHLTEKQILFFVEWFQDQYKSSLASDAHLTAEATP